MMMLRYRLVSRLSLVMRPQPLAMCAVLAIVVAGGCAQMREHASKPDASKPAPSPWALPTSTMRWNEYACELIARNQIGQFPASRTLAYVNLAINNGIVLARQQGRKPDGAAAGAAATVLGYLFPKDEAAISTRLSGETAAIGDGLRADFAAGVELGRTAAADVVAERENRPRRPPLVGTGADRR